MILKSFLQPKLFCDSVTVSYFINHSLFDDTDVFCAVFMLYNRNFRVRNSQVVLFISVFYHTALSYTRSCPVTEASL